MGEYRTRFQAGPSAPTGHMDFTFMAPGDDDANPIQRLLNTHGGQSLNQRP